jgi:hypothetical protein
MLRKLLKYSAAILVLVLIVIQFIQPDRSNPPVNSASTFEAAAKPSPELTSVLRKACYDCHSHETTWPWYSRVAPVSWLVAHDVKEGREHLNFSEWGMYGPDMSQLKLKQACSEVKRGEMPLMQYKLIHAEARLSQADVDTICGATAPKR